MEKIKLNPQVYRTLEKNLLMFYLGITRKASDILAEQKQNTQMSSKQKKNLSRMVSLAKDLKKELQSQNIHTMGEILNTGWHYKKELASGISNTDIDTYYERAIQAGARGGKLLGAGGGGFLLFYVEENFHQSVRSALSHLYELPFGFEDTGTTIIF